MTSSNARLISFRSRHGGRSIDASCWYHYCMQVESLNKKQKYILAISGGVDSVVLLHKTMAHHSSEGGSNVSFIVAHFDHGMRPESADDAEFVRKLAESYGLEYAMERAELGESASEEQARNARYAFLSRVMVDNKAHGIVTAHHQDDVLETMVSNILRGTSPRGLRGFTLRSIIRPLLHVPKSDIMAYADTHSLQWRQDSTNDDTTYTRNYIRKHVMPQLENDRGALLSIRERIITNYTCLLYTSPSPRDA